MENSDFLAIYLKSTVLIIIGFIASLLLNVRFAYGLVLGHLFYGLYFLFLVTSVDNLLKLNYSKLLHFLSFLIRMLILALPLLIAALFAEKISIWGAFTAIIINKLTLMYLSATKKEKK